MDYVEHVLIAAGNPPIDLVLLVGGSASMPMVKDAVAKRFKGIPVQIYESALAIAKGAAIFGNAVYGSRKYNYQASGTQGAYFIERKVNFFELIDICVDPPETDFDTIKEAITMQCEGMVDIVWMKTAMEQKAS